MDCRRNINIANKYIKNCNEIHITSQPEMPYLSSG